MVHRFKLVLVTACLSLTTCGLVEVAAVTPSPIQPGSVRSGQTPPQSPSGASRANPIRPSPASSSPAPPVSTGAESQPSRAEPASSPAGVPVNQLGWVMLALLVAAVIVIGRVVGRNSRQRRLSEASDSSKQPDQSAQSLSASELDTADPSRQHDPSASEVNLAQGGLNAESNLPHLLQNGAQSGNQSKMQAQDIHSQDTQIQETLGVSPTTRLAKVDIVEALIDDLHHADAAKRRKAIWELGQRGDSRAIQPLVDLLMASDSQQRSLILAAVAEISTRTLKPMNRALLMSLQDESADVRKNAIRDITRIYDLMTQVSQLVQYATSDADEDVQETARWALGQLNRLRSVPELEPTANPEHRGLNGRDQQNDPTLPH